MFYKNIQFLIILCAFKPQKAQNLNVLFVIIDDLRPNLGCYENIAGNNRSNKHFITPNIDQLAKNGIIFTNAFAQQALCGPSRTSFLTGRRPNTLRTFDNWHAYWREFAGNFTTIPQYFRENGYETVSAGKVFHPSRLSGHDDDKAYSWSKKPFHPVTQKYRNAKVCKTKVNGSETLEMNIVCPVNVKEQPGGTLPDIETANFAVEFLQNRSESLQITQKPFFLAVGLHKPHIPLKYPRSFQELYPLKSVKVADNDFMPQNFPKVAWNPYEDLRKRDDVKQLNISFPYGPVPKFYQRLVRQSYYSSVSYADFLVGKVLSTLDRCNLSRSTVILLTSDHGWSMGEHSEWSKFSNFGVALRVPFILYIPQFAPNMPELFKFINPFDIEATRQPGAYRRFSEFVELVDIFPTLVDIANLPAVPHCPRKSSKINTCAEGRSFAPLIHHRLAHEARKISWKKAIFAQYPRPSILPQIHSDQPRFLDIRIMGYTVRTGRFQYTEWVKFDPRKQSGIDWRKVYAKELYDLRQDSEENQNVIGIAKYRHAVKKLSRKLRSKL